VKLERRVLNRINWVDCLSYSMVGIVGDYGSRGNEVGRTVGKSEGWAVGHEEG
jgi:hypothetical protein